jgi:hypothetical protein
MGEIKMAFTLHASDNGAVLPWDTMPAAAGTYEAGQLLTVTGGRLTAITAARNTTAPYLCMGDITVAADEELPVTRISENCIYETTLAADAATATIGSRLNIAAGGMQAGSGVGTFEIVSIDGTNAGDTLRGRWV